MDAAHPETLQIRPSPKLPTGNAMRIAVFSPERFGWKRRANPC
jgi:hypothetical protein